MQCYRAEIIGQKLCHPSGLTLFAKQSLSQRRLRSKAQIYRLAINVLQILMEAPIARTFSTLTNNALKMFHESSLQISRRNKQLAHFEHLFGSSLHKHTLQCQNDQKSKIYHSHERSDSA